MATKNMPQKKEDYITNKVLAVFSICLTGVLVLMALRRLIDFGTTFLLGMAVLRALIGISAVGIACGVFMGWRAKKQGDEHSYRILSGRNVVVVCTSALVMFAMIYRYGVPIFKVFYVLLPVLAVYYLIYHSYQPEFCVISANCGAAAALLMIIRRAQISANVQYLAWVAALICAAIAVVQIIFVMKLRANGGKLELGTLKRKFVFSPNAYRMLAVTPAVMAALAVLGAALGAQIALYALFAAAGYLFVTAVYYTVKLM